MAGVGCPPGHAPIRCPAAITPLRSGVLWCELPEDHVAAVSDHDGTLHKEPVVPLVEKLNSVPARDPDERSIMQAPRTLRTPTSVSVAPGEPMRAGCRPAGDKVPAMTLA